MEARQRPWGKVVVGDDALHISGLFTRQAIPYSRISSVSVNKITQAVDVRVGEKVQGLPIYRKDMLEPLAEAILARLEPPAGPTACDE